MPNNKLKIGFIIDDTLDSSDGVQQYVLALGGWLEAQGHEVHYITGQSGRNDLTHLHSLSRNLKVKFNGNKLSMPIFVPTTRVRRLARSCKFDVLHVQAPYSPLMAGKVVKIFKRYSPSTLVVATFHIAARSNFSLLAGKLLGRVNHQSASLFDKFYAVSPAAQEYARQTMSVKSQVIPCPVDMSLYRSSGHAGPANPKLKIVFLGRLVPRKGCMTLLRATRLLSQRADLPDFEVVIAGSGQQEAMLKKYCAKNDLNKIVNFVGYANLDLKRKLFGSADIAVFPSGPGETFGIVLIEAMASGRPVVLGGDNTGYQSVLGSRPEQMFGYDSPTDLAGTLAGFMVDQQKRNQAVALQNQWVKQYDVNQIGQRFLREYKQLLKH